MINGSIILFCAFLLYAAYKIATNSPDCIDNSPKWTELNNKNKK